MQELKSIAQDPVLVSALQAHVEEVLGGKHFSGSQRSQQFLRHITQKSLSGDYESLKERVIAIELYKRSPSYNKYDDAIVRVVASDVRKRLFLHYKSGLSKPACCIDLPVGSYILQAEFNNQIVPTTNESPAHPIQPRDEGEHLPDQPIARHREPTWSTRSILIAASVALVLILVGYMGRGWQNSRALRSQQFYPWSLLNRKEQSLQIVMSDPDFASVQNITGHALSVSDYANGKFFPMQNSIPADTWNVVQTHFRGGRMAAADLPLATQADQWAKGVGQKSFLKSAREIRISDFDTDDNFLLFGGPLANPWLDLFEDELDFRFVFQRDSTNASIADVHPLLKEQTLYSQSKDGFGLSAPTGKQYGIIALIRNVPHRGYILIVAGTGATSTVAAGALLMDKPELEKALQPCMASGAIPSEFEILLEVTAMAGAPTKTSSIACHPLKNAT